MTWSKHRKHERFRVHMSIRYREASDFVTEYAENLSFGGLFLRGAHTLEPLSIVDVEIDLPGRGCFTVKASVAHVLPEDVARKAGRQPGAGLEITEAPPQFYDDLLQYLQLLGRRKERAVLVEDAAARKELEGAGYLARMCTADTLVQEFARSEVPVIGVVIPRVRSKAYAEVKAARGLVHAYSDLSREIDQILTDLDKDL